MEISRRKYGSEAAQRAVLHYAPITIDTEISINITAITFWNTASCISH